MAKVAFLGLGVMGFPMAGHLQKAGHQVTVYNRTAARADAWVEKHGGKSAATPAEAAKGAEIVFACVGNDDDLRSILKGAEGAFAGMGKGALFVDHTTASAEVAREAAKTAGEAGPAVPRCAGLGRPGGGRERQAHRHGRRRPTRISTAPSR